MRKSLLLWLLCLCIGVNQSWAQADQTLASGKVVSGVVTSNSDSEPLIGVSVLVKGTTIGTITDLDGRYTLEVPADAATLVFSFVGFDSKEKNIAGKSEINVTLSEGVELGEVVVSALAIERNAREVVYANQTVNSEDLNSSIQTGALNALQGKVAGVKIQQGSGSAGASTRIVLRGETSITGDNNALIVVDGVPIDNTSQQGGEGLATDGFVDFGNRANDMNPDDIESVTILKGPSATSLYGSRGAAGVVLITTKKGANNQKFKVGLTTSTTWEKAYVQLERQDVFGQGYASCKCDPADFWSGENFSWGPKFDGVMRPWTAPVLVDTDGDGERDTYQFLSRPYSPIPNQLESFFNTGRTSTTGINFSGGNEKYSYYASYVNTDQESIVPGTFYKKNGFTLNATAKFSEKFRSDFGVSMNYVNQKAAAEGNTFSSGIPNGYFYAVQTPNSIPFNEIRDYNSPFHDFEGYYGAFTTNPYFILGESSLTNKVSNLIGNLGLTYEPIEGLSFTSRLGGNFVNSLVQEELPQFAYADQFYWTDNQQTGTYAGREESNGSYSRTNRSTLNLDITAQATYQKDFGVEKDFSLMATAGYNFFQRTVDRTTGETNGGLVFPGWYALDNSVSPAVGTDFSSKYRLMGAFGNATFGFRNMLFLEYSLRNDWSSTLPEGNRGFFYNAGGLSIIASELLPQNDILSYLKFRTSVGTSGNDADLYLLESYFEEATSRPIDYNADHFTDAPQPAFTLSNRIGNPDLRPELSLTFEAGADIGFYNNRINVEYTYYNTSVSDQIIDVTLPRSSGFALTAQNIGEIKNTGHELTVRVNPLPASASDFTMNLFWNFAKNKSEVTKVSDESDELVVRSFGLFGNAGLLSLVAAEGKPYGTYKALTYKRDPEGNIIVNGTNGQPILTDDQATFGSYQPDFLTSFGGDFGWKGLSVNVLFDVRKGGEFYSYTKSLSDFNGTNTATLLNDREDFLVENSVTEITNDVNEVIGYEPNTTPVTVFDYLTNQPGGNDLIDASFIKLRELGVNYRLPNRIFKNVPISSVTVGFIARNLKYWLADENIYADPEVNGVDGTGNAIGIESHATPTARSYGFKVGVNF